MRFDDYHCTVLQFDAGNITVYIDTCTCMYRSPVCVNLLKKARLQRVSQQWGAHHQSGNFHYKNIFVVDGRYKNLSYENACTPLTSMWYGVVPMRIFNMKIEISRSTVFYNYRLHTFIVLVYSIKNFWLVKKFLDKAMERKLREEYYHLQWWI